MTTHRKLIQIAAVAALIAALPAQAQVLGGNLGGSLGGALNGGAGSLHGAGAMNGAAQGAFDTSGPTGAVRTIGERSGSRIRGTADRVGDKAHNGVAKARNAGDASAAASQQLGAKAGKQTADAGGDPAPATTSPGLLGDSDGRVATDGAFGGSAQKDVMGRTLAADGSNAHSASADRSGLAATGSPQANVKAGRKETTVAPETAPANE